MNREERKLIVEDITSEIERQIRAQVAIVGIPDNCKFEVHNHLDPERKTHVFFVTIRNDSYQKFKGGTALFTGFPIVGGQNSGMRIEFSEDGIVMREHLMRQTAHLVNGVTRGLIKLALKDNAEHTSKIERALYKMCQFKPDWDDPLKDHPVVREIIEEAGWTNVIYPDEDDEEV